MKQQKGFLYAYAAGIIDGEGCILIVKERPGGKRVRPSNYYCARVQVGMQDNEAVSLLHGLFGGSYVKRIDNGKDFYVWHVSSLKALYCLKRLRPFLRVKREQANIAIRLQERVSKNQTRRTVSIREKQFREELFNELLAVRNGSKPAVETKRDDPSNRGEAIVHSQAN